MDIFNTLKNRSIPHSNSSLPNKDINNYNKDRVN